MLEPIGLGVSSIQVVASSIVVDVQGLSVLLALDGQTLLVEPPNLTLVAVWLLDDNLLRRCWVNSLEISSSWKHRNNVEWSFNIETEVLVEFSLLWFALEVFNIDDIPKLVDLSVLSSQDNVLVFSVSVAFNFH